MFQNFMMSSLTALGTTNEHGCWQNRPFIACNAHPQYPQQQGPTFQPCPPKRKRTTFTTEQLQVLEAEYKKSKYLPTGSRYKLADKLGLEEKHIKTWFQNKRQKEKKIQKDAFSDNSSNPSSPPQRLPSPSNNILISHGDRVLYPQIQTDTTFSQHPRWSNQFQYPDCDPVLQYLNANHVSTPQIPVLSHNPQSALPFLAYPQIENINNTDDTDATEQCPETNSNLLHL